MEAREYACAVPCNVFARTYCRIGLGHDALVGERPGGYDFEERLGNAEYMAAQRANRPIAVAKRQLEAVVGNLPDVARGCGEHEIKLLQQFLGAQGFMQLDLQVEKLDYVGERLRIDEALAARDDRDAARAELAQFLHRGAVAVDIDRLVVHALPGEEFLGPQAAGAPGLPEHLDALDHVHVRSFVGFPGAATPDGSSTSAPIHPPPRCGVGLRLSNDRLEQECEVCVSPLFG